MFRRRFGFRRRRSNGRWLGFNVPAVTNAGGGVPLQSYISVALGSVAATPILPLPTLASAAVLNPVDMLNQNFKIERLYGEIFGFPAGTPDTGTSFALTVFHGITMIPVGASSASSTTLNILDNAGIDITSVITGDANLAYNRRWLWTRWYKMGSVVNQPAQSYWPNTTVDTVGDRAKIDIKPRVWTRRMRASNMEPLNWPFLVTIPIKDNLMYTSVTNQATYDFQFEYRMLVKAYGGAGN